MRHSLWIVSGCVGFLVGCAWRTADADYVIGPVRYRVVNPVSRAALLSETAHFGLLFEGGRQWGITVGGARRLTLSPVRLDRGSDAVPLPTGVWIDAVPGRWHWSWVYLRLPIERPPVFIRRGMLGVHSGLGAEERALSVGYSDMTVTAPKEDGIYRLDYDSDNPLDVEFSMQVVAPTQEVDE